MNMVAWLLTKRVFVIIKFSIYSFWKQTKTLINLHGNGFGGWTNVRVKGSGSVGLAEPHLLSRGIVSHYSPHCFCFRSNQLSGSSENTGAALMKPEPWQITMATSCWTQVRSLTAVTCGVDSPSGCLVCWYSKRDPKTLASTSAAPRIKTSSMVTTWTFRKLQRSVSPPG